MRISTIIRTLSHHPRPLFLVDALGALTSALLLGFVLPWFLPDLGLPLKTLYLLAAIAAAFFCYSGYCYVVFPKQWPRYLATIAALNLLYCCLTLGLVWVYWTAMPWIGHTYFITELLVMVVLAGIEFQVSRVRHGESSR